MIFSPTRRGLPPDPDTVHGRQSLHGVYFTDRGSESRLFMIIGRVPDIARPPSAEKNTA